MTAAHLAGRRPSPVSPASAPTRAGGSAVVWPLAHLLMPLGMAFGLPVAWAGRAALDWRGAGLLALLGGVALAHAHDRLSPRRRRGDELGNPARAAWIASHGALVGLIAGAGAAALVGGVALDVRHVAAPVVVLALVALSYPLLSRAVLGKTLAVAGCWTLATAALPLASWPAAGWPGLAAVFLLVASGAVLCDLKDEDGDRATGVRSLPALAGAARAATAARVGALGGAALGLASGALPLTGVGLVLFLLGGRLTLLQRELVGPTLVDAALALPALCLVGAS